MIAPRPGVGVAESEDDREGRPDAEPVGEIDPGEETPADRLTEAKGLEDGVADEDATEGERDPDENAPEDRADDGPTDTAEGDALTSALDTLGSPLADNDPRGDELLCDSEGDALSDGDGLIEDDEP